jgi:hypothetical protein
MNENTMSTSTLSTKRPDEPSQNSIQLIRGVVAVLKPHCNTKGDLTELEILLADYEALKGPYLTASNAVVSVLVALRQLRADLHDIVLDNF